MYHWLIPLLAAVANATLCVVVYRHDRGRPLNRVFTLMTATIISWNLDLFSLSWFTEPELAFYWSDVFRVGTLLMPPTIVHTFLVFGDRRSRFFRIYLGAAYSLVSFLIIVNALGWLAAGVRRYDWGYYPIPTHLYVLHTVSVVINLILATGLLVDNVWHAATPHKRLQAQFWLLGAGIGILAGVTNLLPIYRVGVPPLGNLGNVAYTAIVAYAIIHYRLMDINVAVTKGVAYLAVSLVVIAPVFVALLWLEQRYFGQSRADFSLAVLAMLLAVGILFPALRLRAESRIGLSLFRETYEYRSALAAFTRSIVRILDRERLLDELTSTLTDTLHLDRLTIALADADRRVFAVRSTFGGGPPVEDFPAEHPFVNALARRHQAVLNEEAEASSNLVERAALSDTLRRFGWEVCIPLRAGDQLIGFISLGAKGTHDAFSAGDLDLLETLGAEAAVALENARLYEELKKSQDIIRRADRLSALGTLAAGIAHEIRNPLVSIQTFFQLAPERLHDEEFLDTFLGMTANEVKRISDLITELLSFARSPTRSLGPLNLNDLVTRVAKLLEPEARKHKLELSIGLGTAVPIVRADADQVKQVLINLVLNAIQATAAGGSIALRTHAVTHQSAAFGQIAVRDSGAGIPPDRLEHIFDPFFTTKDKGTGLGLAIAHQIIAEHGGLISVDSKEGRGTTFLVDLPAFQQGSAEALEAAVDVDLSGEYRRPRRAVS